MVLKKIKKLQSLKKAIPQKDKLLVGLDIGTENVKALIGKVVGSKIEIIGVGRAHQGLSDMSSGAISDIAGVVANCDKALAQAEEMAGASSTDCVVGIAGELVKGTATSVRFKRKDAHAPIDMAEMQRIITLIQDRAFKAAKEQLGWELGSKDVEVQLVNSAIVSMSIDGQRVTNPIGFQGRELLIQLYTAFAPLVHIGAIEQVSKELELQLVAVTAEPFAVARSVIGDDAASSFSAVLIDVGGGTTDIAIVNDGGVEGTKMFGIGGRSFTRTLANELGTDFEKAEQLKVSLSGDALPGKRRTAVENALSKTLDVWLSGVELALSEFDKLEHLPRKILLCGGGSSLDLLMDALEEKDWYRDLPFTRRPIIEHIDPHQVVGLIDKTGQITDHTTITAMGLLRVGLDTVGDTGSEEVSIKQRLNRLLSI